MTDRGLVKTLIYRGGEYFIQEGGIETRPSNYRQRLMGEVATYGSLATDARIRLMIEIGLDEPYSPVQPPTTDEYEEAYRELFDIPHAVYPRTAYGQWAGYECVKHDPVDNGTKTSECRHCRQRMVFDYPEWRVCK